MTALFSPRANTAMGIALVAILLVLVGVPVGLMVYVRTPHVTDVEDVVAQPVEFDHRHHVRDDGIDCLYCHNTAEDSPFANVPSTELCMGCHSQIWNDSRLLDPVRRSYFTGESIPWNRVHDSPDFAYFNHAVHVTGGVGCVHCHGRVDQMARVYKVETLNMGWCIDCHRNPRQTVDRIQAPDALRRELPSLFGDPGKVPATVGDDEYAVTRLTTCSACHR